MSIRQSSNGIPDLWFDELYQLVIPLDRFREGCYLGGCVRWYQHFEFGHFHFPRGWLTFQFMDPGRDSVNCLHFVTHVRDAGGRLGRLELIC